MRNFIGVVFDHEERAYEALHALWDLDHVGDVTVHGTAVVHRNRFGELRVDSKETRPAVGTAMGLGIGVLLGALAGPVGAAGGAAASAAAGPTIGAAAGGLAGAVADLSRSDTFRQAVREGRFVLKNGQSAVIADVTEDRTTPIDTRMHKLGGTVYRRARSDVENDVWLDDYSAGDYLYPYEYRGSSPLY